MAKKYFIKSAIKHPGALHEELGVPQGKKIPAAKIAAAAKKGGKLGQRARFAQTLAKFQHSPDRYDGESTSQTPRRLEYHASQEQGSANYPSAKGTPSGVVKADGTANMRAEGSMKQSGTQSTPGGQKDSWPSKVDSYNDDGV